MPLYLDTSALAKRYVPEGTSTQTVRRIMSRSTRLGGFVVSSIVKPEVVSALAAKVRENALPHQQRELLSRLPTVVAEFGREYASGWLRIVDVTNEILDAAAKLIAENPLWNVGAADAIHLATAVEVRRSMDATLSLVFVTSDRGLANAAIEQRFEVFDPLYHRPERLDQIRGLRGSET